MSASPTQATRSCYDRVLAYVYLSDGANYSILAARAGVARSYVFNPSFSVRWLCVQAQRPNALVIADRKQPLQPPASPWRAITFDGRINPSSS